MALNLLGTGQLALTKVTVMVREDVPVRSFPALLRELWYRFDPRERMLLLPIAPLDTLDYTSYEHARRQQAGARRHRRARSPTEPPPTAIPDPAAFDRRITGHRRARGRIRRGHGERRAARRAAGAAPLGRGWARCGSSRR